MDFDSIEVSMFKDSSLMGTFPILSSIQYITSTQSNPWILPDISEIDSFGESMPLSMVERAYQAI
jgi:hypothetical protein